MVFESNLQLEKAREMTESEIANHKSAKEEKSTFEEIQKEM